MSVHWIPKEAVNDVRECLALLAKTQGVLQAVLDLHQPSRVDPRWCNRCGLDYPCYTINDISAALRES